MKREQLSDIIGAIDDRQVAEAWQFDPELCGRSPERIGTMKTKRILTFALAAALILALGVGAAAVWRGRLQDLLMKSSEEENAALTEKMTQQEIALADDREDIVLVGEDAEEPAAEEPHAVPYDPLADGADIISLQGYAGSPEFQAAMAWAEFQHNYDRDGSVYASVGNGPTPWDEKYNYNGYGIYSQEMADALEGIAAEYGLTLHGSRTTASIDELYDRFGKFSTAEKWRGYYFDDGTFQCDCETDEGVFQIRRCMKGVLDTVGLNVKDAEEYEQWEYTTACGETVLLALAPRHALILAESEQSFIVVNVMGGADSGISAAELEALADSFDFSIL